MRHFVGLIFFSLWLGQPTYASSTLIELVPVNPLTTKMLLIFPGGKLAPEQYESLAATIDRTSQGRIAVVAARFSANLPNPLQADARIQGAMELLRSAGISHPESHLYLAGHSDGGIMGHGPAASKRLAGLILLGSYIPSAVVLGGSLAEYSLPVLMMIGDRDGHTGVNFLARELLRLPMSTAAWEKPVLLIPGANHLQMADGSKVAEDLAPYVQLEEVHAQVAQNIVDFIDAQSSGQSLRSTSARDRLVAQQSLTKALLRPLTETWTRHESLCASAIKFAEAAVISRPLLFSQRRDFPAFLAAQPIGERGEGDVVYGRIPTYVEPTLDPFDISLNRYVAPPAIACKYLMTSRVAEDISLIGLDDRCVALNIKAVTEALAAMETSPLGGSYQSFRIEFSDWTWSKGSESGSESQWQFGPITLTSRRADGLLQWLGSPVIWKRSHADRWHLEVSHWTSDDGTSHCKMIAPLKIVEWATTLLPKELDAMHGRTSHN